MSTRRVMVGVLAGIGAVISISVSAQQAERDKFAECMVQEMRGEPDNMRDIVSAVCFKRSGLAEARARHEDRLAKIGNIWNERNSKNVLATPPVIADLKARGFTEQEIEDWATDTKNKLLAAGFSKDEVDAYLSGVPYRP